MFCTRCQFKTQSLCSLSYPCFWLSGRQSQVLEPVSEFEVTLVSLLILDRGITTLDSFLFFVLLVFDIDLCHRVKMCAWLEDSSTPGTCTGNFFVVSRRRFQVFVCCFAKCIQRAMCAYWMPVFFVHSQRSRGR